MPYTNFDNIEINREWAFENVRSTEQWTHGYHRYPAKFLPNVVKKIIEDYAPDCKVIADLFAGCGTTLVEAKAHGKKSIGTDINPVAQLITRVKTTPIEPEALQHDYNTLVDQFDNFAKDDFIDVQKHERLDYWFFPSEKAKIAFLFVAITNMETDGATKEFFYVCVSHILKNCSRWLQSSTKPQIDPEKTIPDPFDEFKRHCLKMLKSNRAFYEELEGKGNLNVPCDILLEDARHTSIQSGSVDVIITSPPYVTSYEYADIHQLTGYWMEYIEDMHDFRKQFIGTSYSGNTSMEVRGSKLGQHIVNELAEKSKHIACDVAQYFNDMQEVSKEMVRILAENGKACIVIGNTKIKEVHIKSAEVFYDFLKDAGMHEIDVIKRSIPHKLMPTLRDSVTGKFSKLDNPNCKKVYPNEYVIIMRK
ncbi:MAG: DNA adenine methylase [Muribaculaceae bacterium]|nr:DNA adenine methylase [Muribaculaceae bacterium]